MCVGGGGGVDDLLRGDRYFGFLNILSWACAFNYNRHGDMHVNGTLPLLVFRTRCI